MKKYDKLIKCPGIYLIAHNINILYIGSSKDVIKRIKTHQSQIKRPKGHPNYLLKHHLKRLKINPNELTYSVLWDTSQPLPQLLQLTWGADRLKVLEQYYHNLYLPECAIGVPHLPTASDQFKLYMFDRIVRQARFGGLAT